MSLLGLLFGFPIAKKAVFFRQLATMVGAAMPLGQALETAGIQTNPGLGSEMAGRVSEGNSLSAVMRDFPECFSPLEVSLVHTGEMSGNLDVQLNDLADQSEETYRLQRELSSRLIYPLLVLHGAVFIPPLVVLVIQGLGPYLSLTLSILLPIYFVVGLTWLAYRTLARTSGFRKLMDQVAFFVPVLGGLLRTLAGARFLHALGRLASCGISPDHALGLAADAAGNSYFAARIRNAHELIGESELPSHTLQCSRLFPASVVALIASGEESGQTSEMIGRTARMLDEDLRIQSKKMMSLFPLLLLLIVGGIVGFIVFWQYSVLLQQFLSI